jgi:hypothetical protein
LLADDVQNENIEMVMGYSKKHMSHHEYLIRDLLEKMLKAIHIIQKAII